jgi:hypothetical protein
MIITFYNNLSERKVIRKTLTNALNLSGALREATSVTNPIITVESASLIVGYNYCHIPDFSRYYFVVDIKSMRNNLWAITLKVDVLMSFQEAILNTPAIIDHTSEQDTTNYLTSDVWRSLVKDKTDIINFSNGLSESGGYILITAGG